jgi:hypothetical protein
MSDPACPVCGASPPAAAPGDDIARYCGVCTGCLDAALTGALAADAPWHEDDDAPAPP